MDLTLDQAALAVERQNCPNCDAPAGSACRTRGGKTAAKYHTPRFVLVPALREELEIPAPADRAPGRAWRQGPALAVVPAPRTERPVRIGYARTSTARQQLASQLETLHRAKCHKGFKEQISTRVKVRPELEAALALARQFKTAAPETPVIFTVHELKRLARNAAELMTLSAELQGGGIQLELLTGPLTGIYDPNGMGAMFFAVLAVVGQIERNYIREKTIEGQVVAASRAPRRTAEGHRRRHAHLHRRAQGQGRPRPRHREEAGRQDREERGQAPLGRLALPSARRSRGRRGGRRSAAATQARPHPPTR
ncbi:recombinase family protein [Streptomyces sp. NPDC088246]|uniref:recombinase family protein n=1 Tax=Streptomyces sp. NPDC088246 TaxID=3365842 RepID=UPI003813975C